MTDFTTDELITMAEGMAELAIAGGVSGSAAAGMFYRLIARIRQDDEKFARILRSEVVRDADFDELERERDAARDALKRWQYYGCPDCGGDCSAANPPVTCCIMRETDAALKGDKP